MKSNKSASLTWVVTEDIKNTDVDGDGEFKERGLFGFEFEHMPKRHGKKNLCKRPNFLQLLTHLWPGNWETQLNNVNEKIQKWNDEHKKNPSRKGIFMKEISPSEFWVFWGLIFAARVHGRQGCVWMKDAPDRIGFKVDHTKNMTKTRHGEIRRAMVWLFADESLKESDPWWQISQGVKAFNDNCSKNVWS